MVESTTQPPTVSPAAAQFLHGHLADQGRITGGVAEVTAFLEKLVERQWDTPATTRFSDDHGGGWLVEMSKFLDGEELFGVVRSTNGGKRVLASILEFDDVEALKRSGKFADSQQQPESEPEPSSGPMPEAALGNRRSRGGEQEIDPMLVVYASGDGEKIVRCVRGEVPALLAALLRGTEHASPVPEDRIEIWSGVSKPRVRIEF
jgi:hypothetical protein